MKDTRTPDQVQEDNLKIVDERGPGLYKDISAYVVARDRRKGCVLLGGLGGMGVGQMWFKSEIRHKEYSGWEEAPEVEAPRETWDDAYRAVIIAKEKFEWEENGRKIDKNKIEMEAKAILLPPDSNTTINLDASECKVCNRTGDHTYLYRCKYCYVVGDNPDYFSCEDTHNSKCIKCAGKIGIFWIVRRMGPLLPWLPLEPLCLDEIRARHPTI